MPYSDVAEFRVSWSVGYEQTVIFKRVEVIVPRNTDDFYSPFQEAPEDIVLHSAVHEDHLLVSIAIADDLFAAYFRYLVLLVRVRYREITGLTFRNYDSEHSPVVP